MLTVDVAAADVTLRVSQPRLTSGLCTHHVDHVDNDWRADVTHRRHGNGRLATQPMYTDDCVFARTAWLPSNATDV